MQTAFDDVTVGDSLLDPTEVYEVTDVEDALAPAIEPIRIAPIAYMPAPPRTYEVPTLARYARYATGSTPHVRVGERLDATRRVERVSPWHRYALIAGVVAAVSIGVGVGLRVSARPTPRASAPTALAPKPVLTVTPIETAAPVGAPPVAEVVVPTVHRAGPAARGVLRISSKPPCAIAIDGVASGKFTPQVALPLAVGLHHITLTNEEQGIQLTTEVRIEADQSTSIVQDFTNASLTPR